MPKFTLKQTGIETQTAIDAGLSIARSFISTPRYSKNLYDSKTLLKYRSNRNGSLYLIQTGSLDKLNEGKELNSETLTADKNPFCSYDIKQQTSSWNSGWIKLDEPGFYTIKSFKEVLNWEKYDIATIGLIFGAYVKTGKVFWQSDKYMSWGSFPDDGSLVELISKTDKAVLINKKVKEPIYICFYIGSGVPGTSMGYNFSNQIKNQPKVFKTVTFTVNEGHNLTIENIDSLTAVDSQGINWKVVDIITPTKLLLSNKNLVSLEEEKISTTLNLSNGQNLNGVWAIGQPLSDDNFKELQDAFMVFKGKPTDVNFYEPFDVEGYDYKCPISSVEGLEDRLSNIEKSSVSEEINIENSDKIGFFGNSFLQGYTMKGHHPVVHLGSMSDYIFYNYSRSGDDIMETLERLEQNKAIFGTSPKNWNLKYAILAQQDNDGALSAFDRETYYYNSKKVGEYFKSWGTELILGTEHDSALEYYNMIRLANEEGYRFMDWGNYGDAAYGASFKPFNYNGHPSTRTHWEWTYGMLQYLQNLPRPRKSIKIFRARNQELDNNQLLFSTVADRFKKWQDISGGYTCLDEATQKLFDRVGFDGTSFVDIQNEYESLRKGDPLKTSSKKVLVDIISPYTAKQTQKINFTIDAKNISNIYIKVNSNLKNPLIVSPRIVAFGLGENDISLFKPETQFEVKAGSSVHNSNVLGTYTVKEVVNGIIYTTTSKGNKELSGTDRLKVYVNGSDQPHELIGSYDYPNTDYAKRYKDPLCEWEEITSKIDNQTKIFELDSELVTDLDKYYSFDKISFLLVSSTEVVINNIKANVLSNNNGEKHETKKPSVKYPLSCGEILIEESDWKANQSSWTKVNNSESLITYPNKITMTGSVKGSSQQYTENYPKEVTSIIHLKQGAALSKQIGSEGIQNGNWKHNMYQIQVVARYLPTIIDTDDKYTSSADCITPLSYPCSTLKIRIGNSDDINKSCPVAAPEVGLYWNSFVYNIPGQYGSHIFLEAAGDNIEIAYFKISKIDNYANINL